VVEKRISRKELVKEPDEFISTTGVVITYVREHPNRATAAVAVFLALAVAVAGYFWYQNRQVMTSHMLFEKAVQAYEITVHSGESPDAEKLDRLFSVFDQMANDFPTTPYGEEALLYTGHILYLKKDYQGALDRYSRMRSSNLVKKGLGPMVLYHIANTRLAMKDYDQAVALFSELTKDTNSPYKREAYASVARIYELMNKNKEALQAFRQYLKLFPEAPDAQYVRARIAELSAEG
jgi:outer membrane protein assembly factor BamD (BamD/ComL family)